MTLLDQDVQAPATTHRYRGLAIAATVLLLSVLALAGYLFHLKRHAEQMQAHATESQPLPAPVSGKQERVPIYLASDSDGSITRQEVGVVMPSSREERARQSLRALISACSAATSAHPLPPGSDVTSVYIVHDNLAVMDLNSALVDKHPSGILVEQLTIASLAQTVAANVPGITQVKFLVDGKQRDTLAGHVSLKDEYDVPTLSAAFLRADAAGATSSAQK